MQAPRPQGMGIQMRGLPGAQGGAFTNADTFGAARHRQQQQLAKAGLYASVSMIDEDQNRRAKEDEAHALYANNALRIQDQEKGKALLEQYQGQKADKLPDAVVHHLDTIYSDIDRGLTNDHQREAFSRSFQAYKAQRLDEAYKQRDQQTTAFLETERKGQRKLIQQSTHKSISVETGFDEAINGANYAAYMLNIGRELQEKNLPKEVEELAFQAARKDWHTGNLEACAAVSPELALKYLDDSRAKGAFSAAEMGELRTTYLKGAIEAEQKQIVDRGVGFAVQTAREGGDPGVIYLDFVEQFGKDTADKVMAGYDKWAGYAKGSAEAVEKLEKKDEKREDERLTQAANVVGRASADMSETEMRRAAFENFPEKYADICIKAYDAERKATIAGQTTAKLQRESQLEQEFNEAGGIATNIASFNTMTVAEQTKYLKQGEEYNSAKGEEPDLAAYLNLAAITNGSHDALNDRWSDTEVRDADIKAMGGVNSKWSKPYIDIVAEMAGNGPGKNSSLTLLDTELNNIKRNIELNLADTGRLAGLNADARKTVLNRHLNEYNQKITDYMLANDLTDVKQVPIDERRRMTAETLVTYMVEVPGRLWGSNQVPMTAAEARAGGYSTTNVAVKPGSLPLDIRENHIDGADVRQVQLSDGPGFFDIGVPSSNTPPAVQAEYRVAGPGAVIIRDLISGGYMVLGTNRGIELDSNGGYPEPFTDSEYHTIRNGLQAIMSVQPTDPTAFGQWNRRWGEVERAGLENEEASFNSMIRARGEE